MNSGVKGLYVELHAYQHHVFMDWRFVDDERWQAVYNALNGAGVESMQAKWDEMFGMKEEVVEEVKVKKPRKKAVKKKGSSTKVTTKKSVKSTNQTTTKQKVADSKILVKKSSGNGEN